MKVENINFSQYSEEYCNKIGTFKNNSHYKNIYPPHSIHFFEGLVLYSLAKENNIDIFIESGVRLGGSTSIWGRVFNDIEVYSVEKHIHANSKSLWDEHIIKHLAPMYPFINLIEGDGIIEIPKIIENNPSKKIGILIDGPKDNQAINLAKKCLTYDNVSFASVHDLPAGSQPKSFQTLTYPGIDELVKLTNNLNIEHPGFQSYPQGYNLTVFT